MGRRQGEVTNPKILLLVTDDMRANRISDLRVSEDVANLNPELKEEIAVAEIAPSKYHSAKVESKGMTFASGHEAAGVAALILQEEQHQIFGLRLQIRFPLQAKIFYVADAVYLDEELQPHVVDFKGVVTRDFKLKARLFRERYGREIELL